MAIKISGSTIIDDSRRLLNVGLSTFTGDVSIADKIVHTGDTDTAVRFPAANTFSVETAGSERLRVRSNGVVAIGTDESTTINFSAAQTQIFGTVGDRALSLMYTQANASGPQLNFAKGRDGDNSASTAVSSGDLLGSLHFAGADGSDFNSVGAEIVVKVDGTPGSNDMPGRIEFKTTADGASTTTERLRISADGTCSFSGDVSIADKIVHTGDTNTAIRFPADDTFTIETAGSERVRVSSAGTVSIGSAGRTDWDNSTNVGCQFQIEGLTQPTSRMSITRNSNNAFDGGIILGKSRGTSDGSATIVQDGDGLGFISFQGADGTTMLEGAKIDAIVQSSVASDDMPTDLVFYTNNDTTTTEERLRITSTGKVAIGTDDPTGSQVLNVYANSTSTNGIIQVIQAGTGDAAIDFQLKAVREYTLGIDNSDSNKFKLSSTAGLGSGDLVTITTGGSVGIGTDNPSELLTVGADEGFKVPASGTIVAKRNFSIETIYPILKLIDTDSNSDFQLQNANGVFGIRDTTNSADRFVIKSDGNIGIGSTIPTQLLDVLGNAIVSGVVTATKFVGDGSELTGIAAGGGGGGEFNTGITSTVQATPLSFETTMHTFPSTSGRQYVIESINVANVDESVGVGTTVNIIASIQDATAGEQTYIAYNVPIVTGGVIELLKNPIVAGPSDVIRMWTTNDAYVGVNNAADVYINYAEHESTDFISKFAATTTIDSTDAVTLYTSTSNPTMIEKIGFANRTDTGDFPVSIKITSGTTTSYLAKNLIIPRYSTVDILDRPKRIETDAKIEVEVGSTSAIDVIIAGKKITS